MTGYSSPHLYFTLEISEYDKTTVVDVSNY